MSEHIILEFNQQLRDMLGEPIPMLIDHGETFLEHIHVLEFRFSDGLSIITSINEAYVLELEPMLEVILVVKGILERRRQWIP